MYVKEYTRTYNRAYYTKEEAKCINSSLQNHSFTVPH